MTGHTHWAGMPPCRQCAERRALVETVLDEHREDIHEDGDHLGCECYAVHWPTATHATYREHVADLIVKALDGER